MQETELSVLLARLDAAERRAARAERKGRARSFLGGVALLLGLSIAGAPQAVAQVGVTLASVAAQVTQLRSDLTAETSARASGDSALASRDTALETKTRYQSVSGTSTVFSGTNLFVQSGSGATDGAINGLGNLIVGYNENLYSMPRSGSHNLVVGSNNGYTSYGGAVFGSENYVAGPYDAIVGGSGNQTSHSYSAISGGWDNMTLADYSTVGGGEGSVEGRPYGWTAGRLSG